LRSGDRERKRFEAEERQARFRTKSALEKELSTLEKRILYLEGRQKELVGMLEDQQAAGSAQRAVEINEELRAIISELTSLSPEWDRGGDAPRFCGPRGPEGGFSPVFFKKKGPRGENRRSGLCQSGLRGRGRPRHNVGRASPPVRLPKTAWKNVQTPETASRS